MSLGAHTRPTLAVAFTAATVALAVELLGQLLRIRLLPGDHGVSWVAFGVLAVLLVLSETRPTRWTRVGERDGVTRGWAFAYSLVLLGSPLLAIAVMVGARWYVDVSRRKSAHEIVFNSAQIVASLSMGSLVLAAFGVRGNITQGLTISVGECVGIVVGGLAIFVLNGLLAATVIGLEQEAGFFRAAHAAFTQSTTADGALLALAPVFAIAAESRIIVLPLMAITACLVFGSARSALRRTSETTPGPVAMIDLDSYEGRQLLGSVDEA